MRKKPKRWLVFAKPVRARGVPKYWPRDEAGKVCWVGVLQDGVGWVIGDGASLTAPQASAAERFFPYNQDDRKFKFKREAVT